jgi:hypothetical protein
MDPLEIKAKKEVAKTDTDLDALAKSLEKQTAEIKAKQPLPKSTGVKPQAVNLSVKDVNSAAQKQTSPPANAPQKKGFLGIFK